MRSRNLLITLLVSSVPALAAVAFGETIAITGAKIHPVSGPVIENGTIVITDATITAVGANVPVPAGARVVDGTGKWVTPGLINAATSLGVVEVGAEQVTNDDTPHGDRAVAAAFRVWEGLNAGSVLWAPARNEGITSVVTLPNGALVSGQAAFVDTSGVTRTDMVRRGPVAMVVSLTPPQAAETRARGEVLLRLRELLEDARVYTVNRKAYDSAATRALAAGRLHLEALQPVLDGKLPLLVAADRAGDIESTLDLAREFKLRVIILGGAEGWMVADRLAQAKVPVLATALDNIPRSFSALGARQENAALLRKAGVQVVIIAGAGETFNVRNVRQHAGNAVAYGLSWDDALRAVTLTPAEVFGVETSVGSLQPGRDANVVVWDGDPFEFATRAELVFVKGREVQQPSRQDQLIERYKARTAQKP